MDSNTYFTLHQLQAITDDFSKDQYIGSGLYGYTYKAVLNGEVIAVKRFHPYRGVDDDECFDNEFRSLNNVFHKNITRLIGYCCETVQHGYIEHNGDIDSPKISERLLCFEYIEGDSLGKYILDVFCELDWPTCYKIIQETCEGLNHLHNAQEKTIFHLDLTPANILLDKSMTPKIISFGQSRLVASAEETYQTLIFGTLGYMPPEYVSNGIISKKFDVFSLGVIIIKMMAGVTGYSRCSEVHPKQFVDLVSESWKVRLQLLSEYSSHGIDIIRVRRCVEIALRCVENNRDKRPSIEDIVHELEELEAEIKKMMSPPLTLQMEPKRPLRLQYLKDITNNFCNERILGEGAFGVVYKGLLKNGQPIAVKKLLRAIPSSQKQFENEVNLLMKLEHQNIVRLVGYCYETQRLHMHHEGKSVFAENTECLLCLEFLPNGSLDKYISDASTGLDWHTRWKIIEGISYGLQYLHEQSNDPIIHLDLKPANILLDENMLPKITDFGLSRVHQTSTIHTINTSGTFGYMPPEFLLRGIITFMSDIFSLGVIILEVITGHRDYPYDIREYTEGFVKLELQKWRNRLQREGEYTLIETDCQQIERCIQIGLMCVNPERTKRPAIKKIIDMLKGFGSVN